MLIDTHCHLDATEFDENRNDIARQALRQGIAKLVIPAVARSNFDAVMSYVISTKIAPTRLVFILCM